MHGVTPRNEVGSTEPGRRERQRLAREARVAEAMEAANRRASRSHGVSLAQRIADAQEKLARPIAQARPLLDNLSDAELQVYLLAEELGQNRKGVLQGLAPAGREIRARYELESRPIPRAADSE